MKCCEKKAQTKSNLIVWKLMNTRHDSLIALQRNYSILLSSVIQTLIFGENVKVL